MVMSFLQEVHTLSKFSSQTKAARSLWETTRFSRASSTLSVNLRYELFFTLWDIRLWSFGRIFCTFLIIPSVSIMTTQQRRSVTIKKVCHIWNLPLGATFVKPEFKINFVTLLELIGFV